MIFIVLSTILFGLLDSLWGPTINKFGHFETLFHRTIISVTILIIFFVIVSEFTWDFLMILLSILSGIIAFFGVYTITKAFSISGTISIVVLNVVTILVGQLFSLLFFKSEIILPVYTLQILFSILIIALLNNFSLNINKGIKLGLVSSLCFGFSYPLLGIPIKVLGNVQSTMIQESSVFLCIILWGLSQNKLQFKKEIILKKEILLLGLITSICLLLYFYSYTLLPVYKVNLISNFYPVSAMIFSYFIFKERITKIQFIGVVLSLLLLIHLSLF